MKIKFILFINIGVLFYQFSFAQFPPFAWSIPQYSFHEEDDEDDMGGGGPGEVPTPFETLNRKVELADRELYLLVGQVRIGLYPSTINSNVNSNVLGKMQRVFFEVDLKEHPWLASQARKKFPFYILEGVPSFWGRYLGMKIHLICEARTRVFLSPEGLAYYVISLQRLVDPKFTF